MLTCRRRKRAVMCLVGLVSLLLCLAGLDQVVHTVHTDLVLPKEFGVLLRSWDLIINHTRQQNQSQEDDEAYQQEMSQRRQHVHDVCVSRPTSTQYLNSKIPVINIHQHFLHCPVTKAASTFWGRFVEQLDRVGPMQSPFTLLLKQNTPLPKTVLSKVGSHTQRLDFLKQSVKSLFVRDPYHRVFSAYVDKVFAPNPYYWKEWGLYWTRVARRSRSPAKRTPLGCHHNLTFSDVMLVGMKYFYKSELHFVPASARCLPCQFQYDIIGKMETFSQDLTYLSKHLNLSLTDYFNSHQFRYDYAKDAIEDSINSPFGWLTEIYHCMTKHEMGLRIWRKLQIRGLIDRRLAFPYSSVQFEGVTAQQFINASLYAYLQSTDRAELSRQKREAMMEAYRSVDMGLLKKAQDIYKDDFMMFGYDSSPDVVFDRHTPLNISRAFDWSKPWTSA